MKILMVSSFLPYPLYSGGQIRLYNLIKELSSKHEITLICEKRQSQSEQDVREVEKICKKVITVDRNKQWTIGNVLKTAASLNSFLLTGHTQKNMQEKIIQEMEKEKFDLIHVETFYVMQNLPATLLPVVLAEHNIEFQVYKKYLDHASFILKPLLSLDIAKIKREEEIYWKKATKLIAVSENDAKVMIEKGIDPVIVANGVDTEKFKFKKEIRIKNQELRKILFIGDFKWIQNRDAAKFIIKEIWPEFKSKVESSKSKVESKLWIVGRKIPDSLKSLTIDPDIIFDEESSGKPTQELFYEADILLAPIRIGGGTSYKILESMSCGTPVVTTPLSAGAINARYNHEIIVGETAEELASKTFEILQNPQLYGTIAKNGRKLIENKYTWKEIAGALESIYRSV
ncbi:MAG TPA: glycosyltransferase family 4 protein [Xanthomonadales bacterium]|nr:glycosyltransferase family 4 protein [Xanthomonadales bacterium]